MPCIQRLRKSVLNGCSSEVERKWPWRERLRRWPHAREYRALLGGRRETPLSATSNRTGENLPKPLAEGVQPGSNTRATQRNCSQCSVWIHFGGRERGKIAGYGDRGGSAALGSLLAEQARSPSTF